MFPFDHTALPRLTTRKALIGVDFQHDFIAPDGALPVSEPQGFVERTVELANAFRASGDVVWVQSHFDEVRPAEGGHIIANDDAPIARVPSKPSRGRRPPVLPIEVLERLQDLESATSKPDPEAFLSHDEAVCVKANSPGNHIASIIEDMSSKTDMKLTKTHYSAFQAPQLLRVLRAKMVMELYICGSLANIGVYATALDAAGHGMAITIVDDCCGYRSEQRKLQAIKSLIELTGCEIASFDEVMETLQPERKFKPASNIKATEVTSTSSPQTKQVESPRTVQPYLQSAGHRKSQTPDFIKDMASVRLASDPPSPAPSTSALPPPPPPPQTGAPSTCGPEQSDSQPAPPLKVDNAEADATVRNDPIQAEHNENTIERTYIKVDSTTRKENIPHQRPNPNTTTTEAEIDQTKPTDKSSTKATMAPNKARRKIESDDGNYAQQTNLCEGDTDVIENILSDPLADTAFDKLRDEVQWQRMSHQGGHVPRLVAVQGEIAQDGSFPVYRHPSDESPPLLPFSPVVQIIKEQTEKHLGHSLNHVLIQYYRDGNDYISEHSDKTLDIVPGSYIANVSLGAERTMVFRTKRKDKNPSQPHVDVPPIDTKRKTQRVKLPHNSLCRLGLQSNMKWLHAIRQDKRSDGEKSVSELAFKGGRISLTFRSIGTFLNSEGTLIWGQGAKGKTRQVAHTVINGQTPEAIEMLKAFGTENHATDFNWDAHYGRGFDVLHMSNAPRFFASTDPIINKRIAFMLTECGVNFAKGSITAAGSMGDIASTSSKEPTSSGDLEDLTIKFIDKDKSVVQGDVAIMLYLDSRYGLGKPGSTPRSAAELAVQLTRFQQGLSLLKKWRILQKHHTDRNDNVKALKHELKIWDEYAAAAEGQFLAGPVLALPDFAVWPVLDALTEGENDQFLDGLPNLRDYYDTVAKRPSLAKLTGNGAASRDTQGDA